MLGKVSFGLFALGVMVAISGAAKVPEAGSTWPDTLWVFAVGAAMCVVGLAGWWTGHRAARSAKHAAGEGLDAILRHLDHAQSEARAIREDLGKLDGDALRRRIDDLLLADFEPVVENRAMVVSRYGMKHGAEILLGLAAAERNLNRVWSAAADGCLPEAHASLATAIAALDRTVAMIDR
ncbi:MAG: hypothetical protein NTW96_25825 [Planctomycetia bacterium]|nr:hypothetical protein [Planctomycetia bacterium]